MTDDKLSKIHQYLLSQNVANVPQDYNGFVSLMEDDTKADKVHKYLLSQNIKNVNPDFNLFKDYIGLKKKEFLDVPSTTIGSIGKELSINPDESSTAVQPSQSAETPEEENPFEGTFDRLTEVKVNGVHKTGEPVTAENYITAAPQAFNKRFGEALRNIGEIVNIPKNTIAYYLSKHGSKGDKTTQKYLYEALTKNIPGDKTTLFSDAADFVENIGNPKPIPQNLAGSVLSTLGSVAFDIATVRATPTSKLNALAKYGMERVPMFPTYLGIMQGATTARQGGNLKQTALGTAEGVASGLTYEGMGLTAGRVGDLVKKVGAGNITSVATRALANSALFEGDSRLKGGEKWTGAITGAMFGGYDIGKEAVLQSIAKRAYTTYLTTTDNAIRTIAEMKIDPIAEREKSDKLWAEYEKETDPVKKKELLDEKTAVDNIINTNAITQAIVENPQPFLDQINKDPRLSDKEKQQWSDKIGNTVRDADPRIIESEPIVDRINQLTQDAQNASTLYQDPIIREEKVNLINGQIKELRKGLVETLSRPLQQKSEYTLKDKPIEREEALKMITEAEKAEDLEGLKVSNDKSLEGMIKKRFGQRIPEEGLAIGDQIFTNKQELFKYLDEVAVDEKGMLNKTWFDRELDSWPSAETISAINEWTDKKKVEIKSKEETDNATENGTGVKVGSKQEAQGLEQGEESGLRVRDTEKDGLETEQGKEIIPITDKYDTENKHTEFENISVGDYAVFTNENGVPYEGEVVKKGRTNITIKTKSDMYGEQELVFKKNQLKQFVKPKENASQSTESTKLSQTDNKVEEIPQYYSPEEKDLPAGIKKQHDIYAEKGALREGWQDKLNGIPKKLVQTLPDGTKVYEVDGTYLRDNIDPDWTEGGNPAAYPNFTPKNEIWVESVENAKDKTFDLIHEWTERNEMIANGTDYEKAHEIALKAEEKFRDTGEIPEELKTNENRPVEPQTPSSGTNVPPPGDNAPQPPKQGENKENTRKMEIARKAVEDSTLSDDVKQELLDKGIDYVPRGRKFTDAEAEQIVSLFDSTEGGLDKLSAEVYNTSNGILPDTRTYLNTIIADRYNKQLEATTDPKDRARLRDKLTEAVIFGAEQGTLGGQLVEAQKRWGKILGSSPELIVASVREKLDRERKSYFADKTTEVEFAKKLMEEFTNTPEFKEAIQKGVGAEIDKIGTKNWGKESKAKIDDFFNSLLIDPKQEKFYGGLLGIPVAMYNGSILAIKNALLLGVDLATAIQRGAEYLDKEFGDEKWNRADYINDTKKRLQGLTEKVPTVEKAPTQKPKKPSKPRKEKLPPTQEEVVNKLFEKMAKFATRKQVTNFVQKYLQELSEKGAITDPRFRAILAKALGRDYVTEQTEAKLTHAARAIAGANKKMEDFAKTFEDYINEYDKDPKSENLAELKKRIEEARKASDKATFNAKKANQAIKEVLNDEPDLIAKMGTLIQGNLLVPSSQVANIVGNVTLLPATSTAYLIAGGADAITSGILRALEPIKAKIDPVKHPWLYRQAQMMPSSEREIRPLAYMKGYLQGFPKGIVQGSKELKTGAVSGEFGKGEAQRGLHPVDAAMRVYKTLTGEQKRSFAKTVGDVLEALPAGYFGEAQFRALNLGDKPFRMAGERARLSEIFENKWDQRIAEANKIEDATQREEKLANLKGIKSVERDKFLNHPDAESLKEAKQQGAVATYSQSNAISEAILSFERKLAGKDKTPSTIVNTMMRLFKITNLPYVKTPVNITGMALEYSIPLLPLAKMAVHTYKGNKRGAMDDFGKMVIGSAITTVAISLARNGLITTLSDDKDVKAAQMAVGKEGGRINFDGIQRWISGGDPAWQEGDKLYSIKRLGVVSVQLMSIAEAFKDKTPEEVEKQREGSPISAVLQTNIEMLPSVVKVAMEQSIMAGVNTMIQGLLGGEAEKDRWLVNQVTAASSMLYPNTVATISQTIDPDGYFRETRDLSKEEGRIKAHLVNTFKDRLFMGKSLPAKVSIWGQPIERIPQGETWMYNLLGIAKHKEYQKYSFGTRLYELYEGFQKENPEEAKNIFPTQVSPSTKVGWEDSKMTPQQLSDYQQKVGTLRAQEAETYINSQEWEEATLEDKVKGLTAIYSKARKKAEAEEYSWVNFSKRDPKSWNKLLESDAVPLPSMAKKVGEITMNPEEIEQLNNTALTIYAEDIMPYLNLDKKTLDAEKKDIDEKTGQSSYIKELNKSWSKVLKEAKSVMKDAIEQKSVNK